MINQKVQLYKMLTAVAIAFLIQSSAYAIPVTRIDGAEISFGIQSPQAIGDPTTARLIMTAANGFSQKFNGIDVGPFPTIFQDIGLSRTGTPFTSTAGTTYTAFANKALSDNVGNHKRIFFGTEQFSPQANFDLFNITAFVPTGSTNTLILQGEETIGSNPPDFPPSPDFTFDDLKFFRIDFILPTSFNLLDLIENGTVEVSTSGIFPALQSSSNTDLIQIQIAPIPEPNSFYIVLLGLAVVCAISWRTQGFAGNRRLSLKG